MSNASPMATRLELAFAPRDNARILVLGPVGPEDVRPLPSEATLIDATSRMQFERLQASGMNCGAAEGAYDHVIVHLPRSRAHARALIAEAARHCAPGGSIHVDGQKTDGIDSMLRDIRGQAEINEVISKAHGKFFTINSGFAPPPEWEARDIEPCPGFVTRPGVFSAESIDEGSALLAQSLPAKLPRRVVDLGAGWGWLSAQILTREGVERLDLVESCQIALNCARRNITDERARFHWQDATSLNIQTPVDAVIMNPPFHTGRAAEPALGAAFIAAARRVLTPSGQLWMVANRHLPYEEALEQGFRRVEELAGSPRFKIISASLPRRGNAAGQKENRR